MITTKEYRRLICHKSREVNTKVAGYTLIRDTFLNMAIAAKYRNHRYYRRQKRLVHLGQQERIHFARRSHRSSEIVETAHGPMEEYTYAMNMVRDLEKLIADTNQQKYDYESELLPTVEDPPCT